MLGGGDWLDLFCPEVVFVSVSHSDGDHIAGLQILFGVDIDVAVDFRGVSHGAADGAIFVHFVDHYLNHAADFLLQARAADHLLVSHEAFPAFFLDLFGYRVGQQVGGGAVDGGVFEAADAV